MFEKVTMKIFSNLMRKKVTQIQETQRVPIKRNPKRPTARHIIIKMAKFQEKERILKAAKEKRLKKNEEGLREMQDNMKQNNNHIIGIPDGEEDQGIENPVSYTHLTLPTTIGWCRSRWSPDH